MDAGTPAPAPAKPQANGVRFPFLVMIPMIFKYLIIRLINSLTKSYNLLAAIPK